MLGRYKLIKNVFTGSNQSPRKQNGGKYIFLKKTSNKGDFIDLLNCHRTDLFCNFYNLFHNINNDGELGT